jgi:hypothetical protein
MGQEEIADEISRGLEHTRRVFGTPGQPSKRAFDWTDNLRPSEWESQKWRFVPAKLIKELIELSAEFGWGQQNLTVWLGPPPSPGMDAMTVELRDEQGTLITSTLISAAAPSRRV